MKSILSVLVAVLMVTVVDTAQGCNVCGCGVGNNHYGILPQFQKNFVGVRYHNKTYRSHLGMEHAVMYSNEHFQSVELWARFYPAKRVQVFAFLPYKINERTEGSDVLRLRGIGDASVSVNYSLINTYDSALATLRHNLMIGGGVKLPTGNFQAIRDGLTVNQNFQLGTGSVDFLVNMIYTLRYATLGLNTEAAFTQTTTNRDDYRFGNSATGAVSLFNVFTLKTFTIMPYAGISGEIFTDNRQYDVSFDDTGGWAMLYQAGLEVYYKNIALGTSAQFPGKQELFNGHVTANNRYSAHVTVMW